MSVRQLDVFTSTTDAEVLGSYALLSPLAAGELTTVHRARLSTSGDAAQHYALKRLQQRHVDDHELRGLLVAAGRAGLRSEAANLVRVLDVHEEPEPYVVSEYVEGANLATMLAAASPKDAARYVIPILVDALGGLQALHELRAASGQSAALVHGAPCARHILVGVDGIGRITDLTHAVGLEAPWSVWRELRLDPGAMAPEQALAPAHVDPRCDLFIVGTVLWQALTGLPLFGGENREAALQSMLRKPIVAPSEATPNVGRGFDGVCRRALQRSRAERYGSAAEMAQALREAGESTGFYASRAEIGAFVRAQADRAVPQASGELQRTARTTMLGLGGESRATGNTGIFQPALQAQRSAQSVSDRVVVRSQRVPERGAPRAGRPALPPSRFGLADLRATSESDVLPIQSSLERGTARFDSSLARGWPAAPPRASADFGAADFGAAVDASAIDLASSGHPGGGASRVTFRKIKWVLVGVAALATIAAGALLDELMGWSTRDTHASPSAPFVEARGSARERRVEARGSARERKMDDATPAARAELAQPLHSARARVSEQSAIQGIAPGAGQSVAPSAAYPVELGFQSALTPNLPDPSTAPPDALSSVKRSGSQDREARKAPAARVRQAQARPANALQASGLRQLERRSAQNGGAIELLPSNPY